jgi:hypothetical protein
VLNNELLVVHPFDMLSLKSEIFHLERVAFARYSEVRVVLIQSVKVVFALVEAELLLRSDFHKFVLSDLVDVCAMHEGVNSLNVVAECKTE